MGSQPRYRADSRTLKDCVEVAKATSQLPLIFWKRGPSSVTTSYDANSVSWHTVILRIYRQSLLLAKREEQKARHEKYNDTEYNLSPI